MVNVTSDGCEERVETLYVDLSCTAESTDESWVKRGSKHLPERWPRGRPGGGPSTYFRWDLLLGTSSEY